MNDSQFEAERRAVTALQKLMEDAVEVRQLYEEAGAELPSPLARMLGSMSTNGQMESGPKMTVPRLPSPPKPADAGPNWIWIDSSDLLTTNLVLAILRLQTEPIRPKDLIVEVEKYQPGTNYGSMTNSAARLGESVISRGKGGWRLLDRERAPVLAEGKAWGPPSLFQKQELAAHRRMVILHLLGTASDGLMVMQIVRQLSDNPQLCKAPATKDLIKVDMGILMDEGKAKKIGSTKKWRAVRETLPAREHG
ncbi:MAG: hypothetical protein ACYTG0_38145 [Planctomycetota bacterium]|jgi:hypothetical protein